MPNYTIDPVTGIFIPTPGVDPGPDYATNVSNALTTLAHLTHTGAVNLDGYQIPSAGLNINNDLSFQSNNITNLRSARLISNVANLSGSGDLNCLYDVSGNLWFNNGTGVQIQLTNGSVINSPTGNAYSTKVVTANYTIASNDPYNIFRVSSNLGAFTITLPAAASVATGRFYIVWDQTGQATTNNITIRTNGSDTINGSTSYNLITNNGSVMFVGDGTSTWTLQKWGQNVYNTGETLTFNTGSNFITNSFITMNSGSGLNLSTASQTLNNGSGMTFNDTSQLTMNGTGALIIGSSASLLSAGTLNITSGGTLGINLGATQHVKSGGNLLVDSGGAQSISNGGLLTIQGGANLNVASGGNLNVNSGAFFTATNATTTFNGNLVILEGGVTMVTSGSGNFVTIASGSTQLVQSGATFNMHGTHLTDVWPVWNLQPSRTQSENIWNGFDQNGTPSNWNNFNYLQGTALVTNTNSQINWALPLARTHNGATLATVFVVFAVNQNHVGVPSNLPGLTLQRFSSQPFPTNHAHLSSNNFQQVGATGSVSQYQGYHFMTYTTNQNNVIDNTNYTYILSITPESGTNALAGFNIYSVFCQYNQIPDQSWNI